MLILIKANLRKKDNKQMSYSFLPNLEIKSDQTAANYFKCSSVLVIFLNVPQYPGYQGYQLLVTLIKMFACEWKCNITMKISISFYIVRKYYLCQYGGQHCISKSQTQWLEISDISSNKWIKGYPSIDWFPCTTYPIWRL